MSAAEAERKRHDRDRSRETLFDIKEGSSELPDDVEFSEDDLDRMFDQVRSQREEVKTHADKKTEQVQGVIERAETHVSDEVVGALEETKQALDEAVQERQKQADKDVGEVLEDVPQSEQLLDEIIGELKEEEERAQRKERFKVKKMQAIEGPAPESETEMNETEEVMELSEADIEVIDDAQGMEQFMPEIGERPSMTADEQLEMLRQTSNELTDNQRGVGDKLAMALSTQMFALMKERKEFKENREAMEQKVSRMHTLEDELNSLLLAEAAPDEHENLEENRDTIQQLRSGEIKGARLIDSLNVDTAKDLAKNLKESYKSEDAEEEVKIRQAIQKQFGHFSRAMTGRVEGAETPAFIKPSYGDMPGQGLTIEAGSGPMREWLAYQVSEMFGGLMVPPTATRYDENLDGFVSVQKGAPGELAENYGADWINDVTDKDSLKKVGIGDYLFFNNDGGKNNIQVGNGTAHSIDNARSFSYLDRADPNAEKIYSEALNQSAGERVPDKTLNKLEDFLGNEKKQKLLKQCFDVALPRYANERYEEFIDRVKTLVDDPVLKSGKEYNERQKT